MKRAPTQTPSSMISSNRPRVIEHLEAAGRAGLDPQRAPQLAAGRVGGVQHPANRVRRFAGERDLAMRVAIEPRAPVHQLAHVAWAFFNQHAHRLGGAQAVARGHGVGKVKVGTIVGPHGRGDSPLGVPGVALRRGRPS